MNQPDDSPPATPIKIVQGETWQRSFYFAYSIPAAPGVPATPLTYYDLTGCTVRMSVRAARSSSAKQYVYASTETGEIVLASGVVAGVASPGPPGSPNGYTVTLLNQQTLALPDSLDGYYDVFVDFPTSPARTQLFQWGPACDKTTVTR